MRLFSMEIEIKHSFPPNFMISINMVGMQLRFY